MTTQENLKKYQDWVFKMSAYQMALSIIGIDKQTVAPIAGTEYEMKERHIFRVNYSQLRQILKW